jgi:diaminopimelate decarboxylase
MIELPVYQPPNIVRYNIGWMNKFGRLETTRPLTHIDGIAVDALVTEFGSPLFVFSQRTLRRRHRELREAFARRYPNVRLAWSYKTNYLEAICKTFHREGSWAEVVSPFEYEKALRFGISPTKIHWNGPYKPDAALVCAIEGGSFIHIDSLDELQRISALCRRIRGPRAKVAIRLNMNIEGLQSWSRFGLNLESGQAHEALRRIVEDPGIELAGLHTHIGTFIQEPKFYREAAKKVAELYNEIVETTDARPSFIDMGGGFASPNTLKGQYLRSDQSSSPFDRRRSPRDWRICTAPLTRCRPWFWRRAAHSSTTQAT